MAGQQVRIDLGCGNAKKPGYVGLDYVEGPQVDHVLDLTSDRYPFDDDTVDAVFSAHFLEHIDEPNHVFGEIGRICRDGARIEFWTPYAFSEEAFLYGHLHYLTEEPWMHFCVSHRDAFAPMLGGRWLLHNINFVVPPATAADLDSYGVPPAFAIKYLKGVVYEFGVDIEFRRDLAVPPVIPTRTWSTTREGERLALDEAPVPFFARAGSTDAHAPPNGSSSLAHRAARRLPEPVKAQLRRFR